MSENSRESIKKHIRYVIFGTGIRARRLYHLLGESRIVAFIDNYPEQEMLYNKPVIGVDEYLSEYNKYVIVISPKNYENIEEQLKKRGIYHYFIYDECPNELVQDIQIAANLTRIKEYIFSIVAGYKKAIVCGLSLYSIVLYEWLAEAGFNTSLCIDDADSKPEVVHRIKDIITFDEINKELPYKSILLISTENWIDRTSYYEMMESASVFDLRDALGEYNDKSIIRFKNIHAHDKRCFIVATGPSLKMSDLDFLHNHHALCISMNKIFYAFDETEWRPDYYVATDPLLIASCKNEIIAIDARAKFVSELEPSFWKEEVGSNIYKIHMQTNVLEGHRFSDDLSRAFEQANTVTFIAMQLASYMGFKEIYLIGTDHTGGTMVNSPDRHFYGAKDTKAFKMRLEPGMMEKVKNDYIAAEKYSRSHGFRIYNATRGGNLEVFERVDLDTLYEQISKEKNESYE